MEGGIVAEPTVQDRLVEDRAQGLQQLVNRGGGKLPLAVQLHNPGIYGPGIQVAEPPAAPGWQKVVLGIPLGDIQVGSGDRPAMRLPVHRESSLRLPEALSVFGQGEVLP